MLADIEQVKRIVVEAGKAALARRGTEVTEFKADESIVTAVDRDTERYIEDSLKALYPNYSFYGEEYGFRGDHESPLWVCDPIDGTTNYVCGIPQWCVSVGLLHNGESVMGAIYLPVFDDLYWAVKGEGAFLNDKPIHNTDRDSLHIEDTIIFTSNAAKLLNIEKIGCRIRSFGSIAIELCYAAQGVVTAALGLKEGIVDVGAALCICKEAGCEFRYLEGPLVDINELLTAGRTERPFIYGPPRLVAHLQSVLS